MIDILSKRYVYFIISLVVIATGLVLLFTSGDPRSIDFTGGTLLEVKFAEGVKPTSADILAIYESQGINDPQVQETDSGSYIIRSSEIKEEVRATLVSAMQARFESEVTVLRADTVGPSIGKQVTNRAAIAVSIAALAVVLYITIVFRSVPNAFRYGVCAIIAMAHDVAIVFAVAGIGTKFFNWQVDSLFLTALLTVIGFSVQDKIVVFDRIRENTGTFRKLPFETLVNHSIVQTLQRSINTQLMTVEFLLLSLILLGGVTLREFASILMIGLLSGTYSSIFIAAPTLVVWEKREWRTWFKRSGQAQA
jgi:preprotein translocase subunit SecF